MLDCQVRVQSSDNDEGVDAVAFDCTANLIELFHCRNRAASAQLRTTVEGPAFYVRPREIAVSSIHQA